MEAMVTPRNASSEIRRFTGLFATAKASGGTTLKLCSQLYELSKIFNAVCIGPPLLLRAEPARQMGGTDRLRFRRGRGPFTRRVSAAVRHRREARAGGTYRHGPVERALRNSARGQAGVRGSVSRILFRPDFRGQAPARHHRL